MTSLIQNICAAPAGAPLVVTETGTLDLERVRGLGLTGDLDCNSRVALCIRDPRCLIETLLVLDGRVASMLLVSSSQPSEVVVALARKAACDCIVTDRADLSQFGSVLAPSQVSDEAADGSRVATTWLMTTSGTTAIPKIVAHDIRSLSRTVYRLDGQTWPVWGLLYEPTRFAGIQVILQSLIGGGTLVVPSASAPLSEQVSFLARQSCSHLSATPTLWRRLLMVKDLRKLPLRQVTLGGETITQDLLDALRATFGSARITQIYASTEAGVGFAVNDGKSGFPEAYLNGTPGGVNLKIVDGVLWLRPTQTDSRNRSSPGILVDDDGFISSGDMVKVEGGRAYFLGRQNGVINVGGVKIFPELVEQALLQVPGVRLAKVSAKANPITGSLVSAEVLCDEGTDKAALKSSILSHCASSLNREAVPALVRFVDDLEINAAGKVARRA